MKIFMDIAVCEESVVAQTVHLLTLHCGHVSVVRVLF